MSYWVEYRDESAMLQAHHPAPIFCGVFDSVLQIRKCLPEWAKLRAGYKAYGCIEYYGIHGEGFYVYRLKTNEPLGPLAIVPDVSLAEVLAQDEQERQAEVEQAVVTMQQAAEEADFDFPFVSGIPF